MGENLRKLSAPLAKCAEVELNENPENIAHKLPAFRTWLKSQTHLRARMDDQFLIVFLRGAKYNLERAKQKLLNYYVYKLKMPELYYGRNLSDPKIYTILKLGCLIYLPEPITPDGPRVALLRPSRFDLSKHTVTDVCKVGAILNDILICEDDNAIVSGYVLIFDFRDISKSVMCSFNPVFARKLIMLGNKISPTRMKAFHCLNTPSVFMKLFDMIKSVINEKLRDRIHMHAGNLESFYKHVPQRILPKEYGGEVDESEWAEYWWRKIQQSEEFLKAEETFGVVGEIESLVKSNTNEATEFGMEGTFRNLSFD